MKKLFFACLFFASIATVVAQEPVKPAPAATPKPAPAATPAQPGQPAKGTVTRKVATRNYCCPGCDYVSPKPGVCPRDSKVLIREGMFYCPDGSTSREPGKCKDGTDMTRMVDRTKKTGNVKPAETTKPAEPAK